MYTLGIDIGTTSISFVVLDTDTGAVVEAKNIPNDSVVCSGEAWAHMQNAELIRDKILSVIEGILKERDISGIGVTGQMHGILYIDEGGRALSPLYTWLDGRGDRLHETKTYAERFSELTGYPAATGYGLVTHYYNVVNNLVPENAVYIVSIADYIAMCLTKRQAPIMHASFAHSLGAYDLTEGGFDAEALAKLGIDVKMLPEVTSEAIAIGTLGDIHVKVPIGDNQAAFLNSVRDGQNSILVNIGTGGQISVLSRNIIKTENCETRPYLKNNYLVVGSSLCGGHAYAILHGFYKRLTECLGSDVRNLYCLMNEMAARAIEDIGNIEMTGGLEVSTKFCGTRSNPKLRGYIANVSPQNFTPEHLTLGVLQGIAGELHDLYKEISVHLDSAPDRLIGSGNGIRLNPVLRQVFEGLFSMELHTPEQQEEAACGAALLFTL